MERVSSSVMRQLYSDLRKMEPVTEVLGEEIRLEPKWWLGGEPWIEGMVSAFTRPDLLRLYLFIL